MSIRAVTIEAFTEVPQPFWRCISPGGMHAIMAECDGRLTLPEREYLWQLLGHPGEPPRQLRLVFDRATLRRLWPQDGPVPADAKEAAAALLEVLRDGRHRH